MDTRDTDQPDSDDVARWPGWVVLEFGTPWCGHCQAARPAIQAFVAGAHLRHERVEDGKGRPLGRAFKVKLWPTVILLHDGEEVARVVRPLTTADLEPLRSVHGAA